MALTLALGSIVGSFAGAFLKRWAENLATKKDFETLLSQLRRTTQETEEIKSDIAKFNWVEQRRWDLKRHLYSNVLETLWGIRSLAFSAAETLDKEKHKKALTKWLSELYELVRRLDRIKATVGITFNEDAMEALDELTKTSDQVVRTEAVGDKPKLLAPGDIAGKAHELLLALSDIAGKPTSFC